MQGRTIILSIVLSMITASVTTYTILKLTPAPEVTDSERIYDYYHTETLVSVSPYELRNYLDQADKKFLLVDLRSAEEYTKEHIVSAINVPVAYDSATRTLNDKDRLVETFATLRAAHSDKDIIVYCHNSPCMTGKHLGALLGEKDIFIQHLTIGWNEWRYYWTLWNQEDEWSRSYSEDYIYRGSDPGIPEQR